MAHRAKTVIPFSGEACYSTALVSGKKHLCTLAICCVLLPGCSLLFSTSETADDSDAAMLVDATIVDASIFVDADILADASSYCLGGNLVDFENLTPNNFTVVADNDNLTFNGQWKYYKSGSYGTPSDAISFGSPDTGMETITFVSGPKQLLSLRLYRADNENTEVVITTGNSNPAITIFLNENNAYVTVVFQAFSPSTEFTVKSDNQFAFFLDDICFADS